MQATRMILESVQCYTLIKIVHEVFNRDFFLNIVTLISF